MSEERVEGMNEADANLFDQLVESGFDVAAVEGIDDEQRARLERMAGMLGVLDSYPEQPLDDADRQTLVNATLARIDRHDAEQADRMRFSDAAPGAGSGRFGPLELVALAAIVILGVAVIFPIMNAGKRSAMQQYSSQNLAGIGQGLLGYAGSNDNVLPTTQVDRFAPVFGEAADRLDLQPLFADGYLDGQGIGDGYSFQTQPSHHGLHLDSKIPSILMSDSNPTLEHISIITVDQARKSLRIQSQTKISWSPTVLFSDGSTRQLTSHIHEGDDLRLPDDRWEELARPDAFLTH